MRKQRCKFCDCLSNSPCATLNIAETCSNYNPEVAKKFPPKTTPLTHDLKPTQPWKEAINHPDHYGGADNPYEVIKVLDAWNLNFCLGNTVKYIARAGKKGDLSEDLKKARFYLDWEITKLEKSKNG